MHPELFTRWEEQLAFPSTRLGRSKKPLSQHALRQQLYIFCLEAAELPPTSATDDGASPLAPASMLTADLVETG